MDPAKKVWGLLSSMDRLQGTAGLIEAAEIISQEASNLGLDVVARTYQYDGKETIMGLTMPLGWELTDGYCELVSPHKELLCSTQEHTLAVVPYSPGGTAEGSLVIPLPDWSNTTGKIVLIDEEPLVALYKASEKGALGVIWYQERDIDAYTYRGLFLNESHLRELKMIPMVQVKPSISKKLKRLLNSQNNVEAHLEVKSSFKVEKMPVVEARLNPSEKANIVLTAHYCHVGPGSDDNASGSAGLIRVAERLVKNPPRDFGVIFLWVPEHYGTVQWLEKDATLPMEANINLDMIGASQLFSNSAINLNHNPWPLLHPSDAYMWFYLQQLANRPSNMLKVTEQGYGLGSDHAPFTLKGIPGIMPITWPDRYYHSSRDYLDKTDWNVFEMITDAVVMTINALDKPEENIVKGWAHHIYGTELAKNPSGAEILAYFLNSRLNTDFETSWRPSQAASPFKPVMPLQNRQISNFLKARTYKEKQNNLDILLAETIILSKSMGVHDIEAVLKAELGVFDQELYQEATKEFLEKL